MQGKGTFSLDDNQQTEILKRFARQARRAERKFDDTNVDHEIWIQIPLALGTLGKKLRDYIDTWLISKHNKHLEKIVIVTDYKWYFYDTKRNKLYTIKK